MNRILFVTNNQNKLHEAQGIVGNQFSVISLNSIGFEGEIPEDYDTLEENASQKAWFVYKTTPISCFADDTGLEVDDLNGMPGVHSARYAGSGKTDKDNVIKLLKALKGNVNRKAQFRTIVSLIIEGKEWQFEGIIRGTITDEPHGSGGFGYDPIFVPQGYSQTFAELDFEIKNKISHRALALSRMAEFLHKQNL